MGLWQQVIAAVIAAIIIAIPALFIKFFKRKTQPNPPTPITTVIPGSESPSLVASGSDIKQEFRINRSHNEGINISNVAPGATVNITIIDYQDGLSQAPIAQVKTLFEQGRKYFAAKQFDKAIEKFTSAIQLEKDHEKLGALNLQIGNCCYEQYHFIKAAEFYDAAFREALQANDRQGQASALVSLANTYMLRPASDGTVRGQNVKQAVKHYKESLQIFTKDEYPIQYANTQNNLGNAYTNLPAETSQQRAENVRRAIECYKAALEIYKKEE